MIIIQKDLPAKTQKWLADIVLYDLLDNVRFEEITGKSLLSFKNSVLDEYQLELGNNAEYTKFIKGYHTLKAHYELFGEEEVWSQFSFIEDYCRLKLTQKGLYGSYLDSAIEQKVQDVVQKISLSQWDPNGYPLLTGLVKVAYNFNINHSADELDYTRGYESDIMRNTEDDSNFSISNEILYDNSSLMEKLYDPEFYSQAMEAIFIASSIIYSDCSNGRGNLSELYYSILNYLQAKDIKVIQSEMQEQYDEVGIDPRIYNPCLYMYADNGGLKWGHLAAIDPNYAKVVPGNKTRIAEIINDGNAILDKVYELLTSDKLLKQNTGAYISQLTAYLQDRFKIAGTNNYMQYMGQKLQASSVWLILQGVDYANQLCELLKLTGHRIAAFPASDLRQHTYNRFSNFHECINYFNIHENIGSLIELEYANNLGSPNVSMKKLIVKPAKNKLTEYEVLQRSIETKLKMEFKLKSTRNKKITVSREQDSLVYNGILNKLVKVHGDILNLNILDDNALLNACSSMIVYLVELSLQFIDGTPTNYNLKSPKVLHNAKRPETDEYAQILAKIQALSTDLSSTPINCSSLVTFCNMHLDSPDKILMRIYEEHKNIYEYLKHSYSRLDIVDVSTDYGIQNLNFFMNFTLLISLRRALRFVLKQVIELSGLNLRLEQIKNITPLIDGCIEMIKLKCVPQLLKCEDIYSYIRLVLINDLSPYHIKVMRLYTDNLIEISNYSLDMFNQLQAQLQYMYDCNAEINYSSGEFTHSKSSFERDMQALSSKFAAHIIDEEIVRDDDSINILCLYNMNAVSNIIGLDNIPLMQEIPKSKKYWIFSSLGLKTIYPPGNDIQLITQDDINYIIERIGGMARRK